MRAAQDNELIDRIAGLCDDAAKSTGIEIADVQLRGAGKARLLRVFIDKSEGVTHQDCETISNRLGKLLDEQDVLPGDSYTLEVSSLGLERKLSTPRDFARVVGKNIALTVRPSGGISSHYEGRLLEADGSKLRIEVREGEVLQFPFEQVLRAKLKFHW